ALSGVFQVVAGGEGFVAGARQHRHPEIRIPGEIVPHTGHFLVHGGMHGVVYLGTIHGDDENRTFPFGLDEFVCHAQASFCAMPDVFNPPRSSSVKDPPSAARRLSVSAGANSGSSAPSFSIRARMAFAPTISP